MDENPVKQIIEKQVLTVAKAVEDKIDDEIAALDRLDLDDLEALRERRLQQLKKMVERQSKWISLGHDEYFEIAEKDFFIAVKASDGVVCHFCRKNWPCKVVMSVVASGAAAVTAMAQLGKNENLHARWNPICDRFDVFCCRGGVAIIASFIGGSLLTILNATSTFTLYKNVASQA